MNLILRGKRALVTGSSAGIGAAIARVLAAEGVRVAVHGRNAARCEAVAGEIRTAGGEACVVLGDLADDAGAQAVADATLQALGGVDILVNNAGGNESVQSGNPGWFEVTAQDWVAAYQQNTVAAVRLCQRLAPGMQQRGWGRIIQIASASAIQPIPFIPNYQAAKAAMLNLSASLARALAHSGITVNTISPGTVRTPAVDTWLASVAQQMQWEGDDEAIERRLTRELIPLCVPRIGRPEDIGHAAAFLASPLAGYITGANLRVDGGQIQSVGG
jgi:NAD(P)-dependent dehydrogenase (short-subunit alcohol dehydrogenase family)